MNKNINHILEDIKKIKLTAEEKSAMRFRLIAQMEKEAAFSPVPRPHLRPSPFSFPQLAFGKRALFATVALFLIGSTGISFAAENTLPGDLLYPVKIHVTEEMRTALLVGSSAKVNWQKDLIVKRVVETETLIKNNALTPARKIEAEAAIKAQIQKFDTVATEEKADSAAVISATSDLEPTLKAHQEAIATLSANTDESTAATADIISTVEVGINVSSAHESAAIDSVTTTTSDTTLSATIDIKIADTQALIDTLAQTDTTPTVSVPESTTATPATETTSETVPTGLATPQTGTVLTPTAKDLTVSTKTDLITKDQAPVVEEKTETAGTKDSKATSEITAPIQTVTEDTAKTTAKPTDAQILVAATQKKTDTIEQAKAMLALAIEKEKKGEFSDALRLAQQAYKSVLEIQVSATLSKDNAKETKQDGTKKELVPETSLATPASGTTTILPVNNPASDTKKDSVILGSQTATVIKTDPIVSDPLKQTPIPPIQ